MIDPKRCANVYDVTARIEKCSNDQRGSCDNFAAMFDDPRCLCQALANLAELLGRSLNRVKVRLKTVRGCMRGRHIDIDRLLDQRQVDQTRLIVIFNTHAFGRKQLIRTVQHPTGDEPIRTRYNLRSFNVAHNALSCKSDKISPDIRCTWRYSS